MAKPLRQPEAVFTATKIGANEVISENPAPDFPKRIIYRRAGDTLGRNTDVGEEPAFELAQADTRVEGYLANAAAVLLVSMAACYLLARWAGRIDPAVVSRNDPASPRRDGATPDPVSWHECELRNAPFSASSLS